MSDVRTNDRRRYRIRFSKLGKIRFTSHRDVARLWERALRRATVPVAYTEGFSPHPKLSFGLALSTGHESLGEYLDVEVTHSLGDPLDVGALITRLDPGLPIGLDVQAAAEIAPGTPSLQQAVACCTWRIGIQGHGCRQLAQRVDDLLRADSIVVTRERKGQQVTDDVRPAIVALDISDDAEVVADLATQPRGLRPSELVAALSRGAGDLEEGRVMRIHQWLSIDGAREEPLPLPLDATSTPHAQARAS
jgi:radical SAM-linked protein